MRTLTLLFCLVLSVSLYTQQPTLNFLSGITSTNENSNEINVKTLSNLSYVEDKYFGILQFDELPNSNVKASLKKNGIHLLNYLPEKAYYVCLDSKTQIEDIKSMPFIRGLYEILPEYKLHPSLKPDRYPEWIKEDEKLLVVISVFKTLSFDLIIKKINSLGFNIKEYRVTSGSVTLKVSETQLLKLLDLPFVYFIEPINPPSHPENKTAGTQHRSNYINSPSSNGLKYDGTGINVMMQDDGIIGPHIDYQGRIDQSNVTSSSGDHGDHVSGTIMGAGNLNPIAQGMAPGAFLYVFSSSNNNYYSVPSLYQNQGVVITSKSYSNGCNAGYTTLSRDLDEQTNQYPSLIHVFSAGNDGTSNCGYGAGSSWGNITGGHKAGKNVITVGNLDDEDNIANSSSRGPASDGRIKPDVCAKGTNVYSTIDVNTYGTKTGTSMSCPGTSGSITQLYHVYKDLNNGQMPKSSLIKATIMNTAEDLGNPGPDFIYGWGRLNLRRAYQTLLDQNYIYDSLDAGNSKTFSLSVPSGLEQIRVMVYWTDHQGSTSAATALVNDLDMDITAPSGTSYNPWVLNSSPNASSLNANATRGNDHLNNVEQITINNPSSGNYTINVNAYNIPYGPQDFYIVYEFRNEDITLTYPSGGEPFVPGETEKIRWDAYSNTGTFTLEYSLDSGATWANVTTNINGSLRYYDWTVPSGTITGNALVRISRGSNSDVSNSSFSIIGVPNNISSLQSCTGNLTISWDPVSSASGYTVFVLGNMYMDSVGYSNSNQFSIPGLSPNTTYWVSVNATGANKAFGRRAIAVQLQSGNSTAGTTSSFSSNTNGGCDSTLSVLFTNTSVNGTSFYWNFGDGTSSTNTNPTHTYQSPGIYDVTLIADGGVCGIDTLIMTDFISVGQLATPTIDDVNLCSSDSVVLTAVASGTINWFNTPTGGTPIGSGSSYTTPIINNTTTYYVQANSTGGLNNVGPVNNSIGNGAYFNSGGRYLVFDAYTNLKINSVWVDANGQGNRTIELRNSNGTILQDTVINIPNGQSRVTLNFNVPAGTNLQLGVNASSTPNLYRTSSGLSYPYTVANVVSIKQSNANTPLNYYYFFYDWEVEVPSCSSNRKAVTISISQPPTTYNASNCGAGNVILNALGAGSGPLHWYDSSSGGNYLSSGASFTTPLINSTTNYYVEQEILSPSVFGAPFDNSIGTGGYFTGDQHLVFDCILPSVLRSVKVYAGSSGNRTVELRSNNGTVLQDTTLFFPAGESRAVLNFDLVVNNDYQLGVTNGSSPDLYRNSSGPAYPYNINGLVEITNSSAGLGGFPGYYYYFYDWEVSEPSCYTARVIATANIDSSGNVSINPVNTICVNNNPFNLSASVSGGNWSGTGITDSINGTFSPSIAGTGNHTIIYSTSGNCSDSDTLYLSVVTSVDPTITAVNPVCISDPSLNLVAANSGGIWSGNGITDSIIGIFSPSAAGVGTHTINYTISGSCGSTDQISIVVNNTINPTINPVNSLCVSTTSYTLSASSTGGIWSGTGIIDSINGTFSPYLAGIGTHTITYTLAGSCSGADQINIYVINAADPTINTVNPVCILSSAFNLTAANSGGLWSGTGITDSINGTFDPSLSGLGTHTVTYTISGNCGSFDQINIMVSSFISASIIPTGPYCTYDSTVNLSSINTGGLWSGNGITDSINGTFNPSTAGPGTHVITYVIMGPCGDVQTTNVTVNVGDASFLLPIDSMCTNNNPINLFAFEPGGTWSGNGIQNPNFGVFDPSIAGSGTHQITYTLAAPCPDSQSHNIIVEQSIYAQINSVGPLCSTSGPVPLIGTPAGGLWSGNGITDSVFGIFSPIVAGVGFHVITYTISGNCGDVTTSSITVHDCSSIDENIESIFNFYPNPAQDIVKIKFYNTSQKNSLSIRLNSIDGQLVYKENFKINKGENLITLKLPSEIANGIYLFETSGSFYSVNQLIISK